MSLPDGWKWESMESLAAPESNAMAIGPFGSNLRVDDYRADGVPLVFVRHIRSRLFDELDPKFVDEQKARELSSHIVRPGDVLITKMGDPPGDACVYPSRPPAVITADCIKLTTRPDVDSRYVAHLIESPQFRASVRTVTQGVAQKKVSLGRFRKLMLPVAPLDEQRRIASALDEHLSDISSAEASLTSARAKLHRLAAAVRDRVFGEAWDERPIGSLGQIVTGNTPNSKEGSYWHEGVLPFVTPGDIPSGGVIGSTQRLLAREAARLARVVPAGSVLVTCIGATIGKTGLAATEVALNQQINAIVPDQDIMDSRFLLHGLSSGTAKRRIRAASSSTTMPILNKSRFMHLEFPVPSLERQRREVDVIERALGSIARTSQDIDQAAGRSSGMRCALLAAAFSGRLTGARRE